jgi:hypothetical protein
MPTNVRYAALARLRDGVPLFSHKQNADAEVRGRLRSGICQLRVVARALRGGRPANTERRLT